MLGGPDYMSYTSDTKREEHENMPGKKVDYSSCHSLGIANGFRASVIGSRLSRARISQPVLHCTTLIQRRCGLCTRFSGAVIHSGHEFR